MKKYLPWLGAAVIITVIFGSLYGAVQQDLRQGANDPQLQLAEDMATQLDSGLSPRSVASDKIDIGKSLAPFVVIYNKQGQPVAGNGYLDDSLPSAPIGVLTSARAGHDNKVTWQPKASIRLATVVSAAHNYYVLSGRSLREVEKRETEVMDIAALGWFLSLLALAVTYGLIAPKTKR
jgi:hypothetical protein